MSKRRSLMNKSNNKGFTLLELLIGITIMLLVSSSILSLIVYSSRNYRKAQEELSLQIEAQTIINQLSDLLMEAENVKYREDELIIYHGDARYIITFDASRNELMYEKVKTGESTSGDKKLYGQYVVGIYVVDTGANDQNKTVQISIDLKKNQTEYSIQNHSVTLRNKIKKVNTP